MTQEDMQKLIDASEVTPAGQIMYQDGFIDPEAEGKDLKYDWDAQPRETTDGRGLVDSILRLGLIEPPTLALYGGDDVPEVVRGHRRIDATKISKTEHPEDYKRIFPNGVPVKIAVGKVVNGNRVDLTHKDIFLLRADHDLDSLKESLHSKIECYKMVSPLFRAGFTYAEVIENTWRTVSRILSTKYNELKDEIAKTPARSVQLQILERSQHGNYQFLKALSDSPNLLVEAWMNGERNKGPKFTQAQIKGLASKFKSLQADAGKTAGADALTQENPGDAWIKEFNDVFTEISVPKEAKEAGPKMAKRGKIEEMLIAVSSKTARLAFQSVLGVENAEKLLKNTYDKDVAVFESIRESVPSFVEFVLINAPLMEQDITKSDVKKLTEVLGLESAHSKAAQAAAKGGRSAKQETAKAK